MTTANTGTNKEGKPSLAALLDAPLQATGGDVPPGSYGGTLIGFSEPIEMDATKSQFYKPGQPAKKLMFEATFGVFDKQGTPTAVEYFLPFPEGGITNRKSNVYKMLKALAMGSDLIDANGNFAKGTTLKSFYGKQGVLNIKTNDKSFPVIESVGAFMDGAKYPTMEQCKAIVSVGSDDLPF